MLAVKKIDNSTHKIFATEALRWAVLKLQQAKISSASLDARILLEFVLDISREQLLFSLDLTVTPVQYELLKDLVNKRCLRQPIAQIIGKREFWGLNFKVSTDTLDPRPDSETLIEAVLERTTNRADCLRVLDLGTGTGCLLLSLLSELPNATGVAVDFCPNALALAKENAKNLNLDNRTQFIVSNWCEKIDGQFDIILANPPYIPTKVITTLDHEVCEFEPILALDGGEDGFECYRNIMKSLPKILAKNGFVAFEIGIGQQKGLEDLAQENGLEIASVKKDLSGIIRSIIVKYKNT